MVFYEMSNHKNLNRYLYLLLVIIVIGFMPFCSRKEPMQKEINKNWVFKQYGKEEWLPATVPGCVHLDLLANKKIEDPFYRDNEKSLQWIDKEDWEYKTSFDVDKEMLKRERIELFFAGLDTYSDVYLNDKKILSTSNMYREWRVECKPLLREGGNDLYIKFFSPIRIGLDKRTEAGYDLKADNDNSLMGGMEDKKVSIFTRKAPYHYGWDWGPRFVTSGVWRPVVLKLWDEVKIRDLNIINDSIDNERAVLTAWFEVESTASHSVDFSIEVNGQKAGDSKKELSQGLNTIPVEFVIENPKRWWCNGLGEPYLYNIKASVTTGKAVEEISLKHGIRTVKLIQEPDSGGKSFYFELNGVPVFAKGANYIPSDVFLSRVTPGRYEKIIRSALDANMNMLRVWGGGIYEEDVFYDLCDKNGILVWQDYMFACSLYPGDKEFLENVKQEAIDNVKRLRKHPCIALWCGNNENYQAWYMWGYKEQYEKQDQALAAKIWNDYKTVFYDILLKVTAKYHKGVDYWPSSPMAVFDRETEYGEVALDDKKSGDRHYWGVWHAEEPFSKYDELIPRFMSEYGFQSFPAFETIKAYTIPSDWDIKSAVMTAHQRHPRGNQLIRKYMDRDYKVPKDFWEFMYLSQVVQGEGIKRGIEAHRRNMPYCMGSLYWQLNDCWPVASWSSTDYYLKWKALHYYAKKAFEPLLVSIKKNKKDTEIYVISDLQQSFHGKIEVEVMDFNGKLFYRKSLPVIVEPNVSRMVLRIEDGEMMLSRPDIKRTVLSVSLKNEDNMVCAANHLFYKPVKELKWSKPRIQTGFAKNIDGYSVVISCDVMTKSIFLSVEGEEGFFTDNYFDMLPGTSRTIEFHTPKTIDNFDKKLKITSYY